LHDFVGARTRAPETVYGTRTRHCRKTSPPLHNSDTCTSLPRSSIVFSVRYSTSTAISGSTSCLPTVSATVSRRLRRHSCP